MKRLLSLILSVLMIISSFSVLPFYSLAEESKPQTLSEVPLSDWMSAIRGDTKLTEITIPGTHDTCAKEFYTSINLLIRNVKCQKLYIPELLEAGVRHLDIRCETDKNSHSTKTVHSTFDCYKNGTYYYLDFVFQEVYDFLDAHPTETVILQIKEDDAKKGPPTFTEAIYEYIHGYGQNKYFYGEDYDYHDYWYLGKAVPTLDEVRGKIVLFNRFDSDIEHSGSTVSEEESGQKVNWPDQTDTSYTSPAWVDFTDNNTGIGTIHVQDRYKWSADDKLKGIQDVMLLDHNKGEYYINFTSINGTDNPQSAANKINPKLATLNVIKNKPSGVMPMDFVDDTVTRSIIEINEAVSNIVVGSVGNINYELDRTAKTLTISGSGAIPDYQHSDKIGINADGSTAPWGNQMTNSVFDEQFNSEIIENLVIENGITEIGSYAFYDYDNLTSVSLPETLTSISETAFHGDSDNSALSAVLNHASSLGEYDYSTESTARLEVAINKAQSCTLPNLPQLVIDEATKNILSAIYDLVPYLEFRLDSKGGTVTRSVNGNMLLFGTEIELHAEADEGYSFVGWYESKSKREISKSPDFTFALTSHTHLHAMFARQGEATLICRNNSGWTQQYITKSCEEWALTGSLESILPPVPYQKGYKNGFWDFDETEVLSRLIDGEDVEITPSYEFEWEEQIDIPDFEDIPVGELYFREDTENNVGIFTLAAGIPENAEIKEIGIIFKHGSKETFSPDDYMLMLNNASFNSKFFDKEESGIYVVDVLKFNYFSWCARGYINYIDQSGISKTAYTNQINI